ncbi:MAG: thiamine phosphate synthase [Opitutales bacterium]|nr:thiamine phosphate synthase [Opitutales bacterium]MCH8540169.1 thiamine phosphate synthase [Opitutales bacterium]
MNHPYFQPSRPVSFYAIVDTLYVQPENFPAMVEKVLQGKPDLIQLRAKDLDTSARKKLVESVLSLFTGEKKEFSASWRLLINDDWQVCREFPDIGLHVGQDDLPVEEAREILGKDRILGLSTHSLEQARGAIRKKEVLDYFAVGPIFQTPTKPEASAVGLDLLEQVVAENPPLPFYGIGGVKLDNRRELLRRGAKGLVAVSEVLQAADPRRVITEFQSPDK